MNTFQIFNPGNQSEKELVQNFCIRKNEFNKIRKIIIDDTMETAPQHFIIQGIRGSGKTTLLLRTYYELKNDKKLSKWLIPIIFNEEQYSVNKLFKFWEQIAIELEQESKGYCGLVDKMQESDKVETYEEHCYDTLFKVLEVNKNKICVFIDNIGDILQKLTKKDQQRLREVLITNNQIRIIGASSVVLESTYKYDEPFYEYFKIIALNELKSQEARDFLLELDKINNSNKIQKIIEKSPGRIEALRIITGGVPRTIVLLYEIFINDKNGDSFKDLEVLLDRVTPLYKHRMDDLPTQQQEIVDCIALNWDAIPVKEIARKTRMESKAVSAQLRLLEKNSVVIMKTTTTKNHLYQIKERFFNIWYIMRNGRKSDKNKVKWLTNFLEVWCDKDSLNEMIDQHIEKLKTGDVYDIYAYSLSEAFANIIPSSDKQHLLLKKTKSYLKTEKSELSGKLSKSDIQLVYEDIITLIEGKQFNKAIQKLKQKESKTGYIEYALAYIYWYCLKDKENAEKQYIIAIDKGYDRALYYLALLYRNEFKEYIKAEKYYLEALERGNTEVNFNLADLYEKELKDFVKAEKFYLKAIEKGNVNAMNNLAVIYFNEFQDYIQAEKYFLMASKFENKIAINNLAQLYGNIFKNYEKAEKYYKIAAEKGDDAAMNNLGTLYFNGIKNYSEAEKYFRLASEKGNLNAICNLGKLFFKFRKDKIEALQVTEKAFNLNSNYEDLILTYSLILIWHNKIEKAIEISKPVFNSKIYIGKNSINVETLIKILIAKKQYNYVYKIFKENKHQIKDRLKPIYYALMHFMQDKYPDEIKKMGEELKETVESIVQVILEMREKYK
ncbi:MAG: sel1 repeat family protein [Salinivirgaceae bacterium]|nr:sel1 repeat family protein [Salinivirgaceae bacterium]